MIGHDAANVPDGAEVFVSSAFAPAPGGRRPRARQRAELLAELVCAASAIVVAGAHGKTTTSAMIAFCLDRLGLDPAFLIGGEVPQLGGNARSGEGWLVVEGDESDRSLELLRPQIAVVLNVDLDHHTTFGSVDEVRELFEGWLAEVPHVVRGEELEPVTLELAVPGEHNRRNAAAALAALELAGVRARGGERVLLGVPRRRPAARAARRGGAACGSSTTTRTTRRRSRRRSKPRAPWRTAAACSCSSSRTCTRARATRRTSWPMRSRPPTS